jgi:CSLREA domain-containing protein
MARRHPIRHRLTRASGALHRHGSRLRPALEILEERVVLSTFTVSNTVDDGRTGSLRWAVDQANTAGGSNKIDFNLPNAATIDLTGMLPDIHSNLTIAGPGAGQLTIDGKNLYSILQVKPSYTVSVSGLNLIDGLAGSGGAVDNAGDLTLDDCTISGSLAVNFGGGIENVGTLTLDSCTVSDNSSHRTGGGIYSTGTLTLNGCVISGNSAASGGGIQNAGPLTISGGRISENSASLYGGGIENDDTLTITGCTISNNTAGTSTKLGVGGGIGNAGTSTITGSTISDNSVSGAGGGIYDTGKLTLTGCTVSGNAASAAVTFAAPGGGIDCVLAGTLTMTDCTLSNNSAAGAGGGLHNTSTATLVDTTVSDNSSGDSSSGDGGGIQSNGTLQLVDSTVSGNHAIDGGGIESVSASGLEMIACTVTGNTAGHAGAGLYNSYTPLTMTNCTLYGNTAGTATSTGYGGGIANDGPGSKYPVTLTNCTISSNIAVGTSALGGDILNFPGGAFVLNNSIIANSKNVGGDIAGRVSGNNNLIDDAKYGGGLSGANGNILTDDVQIERIGNYGGLTETMPLLGGSLAFNHGDTSLIPAGITTDQRGAPRQSQGAVDIGAFQAGPTTIVVTTLTDEDNGGPDPALGSGTSLREAIEFTNVDQHYGFPVQGDTITFAPGLTGTLSLSGGSLPTITAPVTIVGPGAELLTVDAMGASSQSILSIHAGARVAISGLTLTDGRSTGQSEGGAITNNGALGLADCTLSGNHATFSGGAIYNGPGAGLVLLGCTLSGNTAGNGGGIASAGNATLADCTLSADQTQSSGDRGAIDNLPGGILSLEGCTLSGNTAANGGGIKNAGGATVTSSTLSGNVATPSGNPLDNLGGAIDNLSGGSLSLAGCTLSGNTAANGGGIADAGGATITGSTFSGNKATLTGNPFENLGGAIDNLSGGSLALTGCTLSGNSAMDGGGISNAGTATLTNCTLSGDTVFLNGAAIYNANAASLMLVNCTLSGNPASFEGGTIYNCIGGTATLDNTIVASSGGRGDIEGNASGSDNLIDDARSAGGLTNGVDGNQVGVDPMLGPLRNNGGPTQTLALLAGSPAKNAGDNSLVPGGVIIDQRGAARIKDGTVDIGAFESDGQILVVTTLQDTDDGGINPTPGTAVSLRDAIEFVNSIDPVGGDTITFAAGLEGTIALTAGVLPTIAGYVAIDGPGAGRLTISGQGQGAILVIQAGVTVRLAGLALAGGTDSGVQNLGSLVMSDCTVAGNQGGLGGGIQNSGVLAMIGCTVSGNSAAYGAGIFNESGTLTLTNCTVANNYAAFYGGGLLNYGTGTLTANDCTVAGNSAAAGGELYTSTSGPTKLNNTIVAVSGGTGGDIAGTVTGSDNLIDDAATAGGLTDGASGNLVGVSPVLGALAYNGGATQTMALLAGSPAIGAGAGALVPAFLITDQRGAPRQDSGGLDIGAFQTSASTIVVTTLADEDDGTISPFFGTGTSLREAIEFANADPGGVDTITFSSLLDGTIQLSGGPLPLITGNVTIEGPGANVVTLDAQRASAILSVGAGATVTVSGLTLANASAIRGAGVNNGGNLTLLNCAFSDDKAQLGGGVINNVGATLEMTGCTLFGNSAIYGGGILNYGTATLTNCTLSGDTASAVGGGVFNWGTSKITNCTIFGNSARQSGGGLYVYYSPTVTLNDTIVAGSLSGGDIYSNTAGYKMTGSNNFVGDGHDVLGLSGTITGDPMLGPLAWSGGSTQTMALLPGSPALGKGAAVGLAVDQRGFAVNSPPDIGAFQYQGPAPSVTISGPSAGTVSVEGTYSLTATDPTATDQNGTFTYTIDWNGDGSDVQTVLGPASFQVAHSFGAAGSYTPVVTAIDQDHRASAPVAMAASVVVAALTTQNFTSFVGSGTTVTIDNSGESVDGLTLVNAAAPATWTNSAPVNLNITRGSLVDPQVDPSSPDAQIDVSGNPAPFAPLFNVNNGGTSPDLQKAATIAVIAALAVIGGSAVGSAAGLAATEASEYITSEVSEAGIALTGANPYTVAFVEASGIVAFGVTSGVAGGIVGGAQAAVAYVAIGASPALIVDQGTVTWSNCLLATVSDSPTIVVNGGTLILKNDWIEGTPDGSEPVIEVNGGTVILGASDGTSQNQLGAYGSAPFFQVNGTGRLIVDGGNTFDQFTTNLTAQAAAATSTQLASSAPTAVSGQSVTYTATLTAAGAPATGGSVEFFDKTTGAFLGTAPVSNGSAALQVNTSALTGGDTIYATYLPTTGALAPSSGKVTQAVVAATTATVTGPPSTPTYGQTATFTATITDTTPSGGTPTGSVEFYDGSIDLGPGSTLSGSGNTATSTFSTAVLPAGTDAIRAVYTPSALFQTTSATLNQTIKQAVASITVTGYSSVTYNGNPYTAAGTATGSGSVNLGADLNLTGTTHTSAGTYTDTWTFTDPNGNYQSASGTVTDVIKQAVATITVTHYSVPYNATAYTATGSATGIGGVSLGADLNLTGTTHTSAGTYANDSWSFTDPNGNYQSAGGTITDVIKQVAASITVTAYALSYNATPYTATGSATGVGGVNLGADLNLTGTTHTNAARYTDTWTFTDPNGNYQSASGTATDVIKQATATVTANNLSKVYKTTLTFAGTEFTASGFFGSDKVTSVTLASAGTAASALVGSYPIAVSSGVGSGLANYTIIYVNGTLLVTAEPGSVFILDPKASGALSVSGSAALKAPGNLIVDSSSPTALSTSGTAAVTAAAIQVTGGYQKASTTTISTAPVTGVAAVPDPLGGPAGPSPSGMKNYGAYKLASGSATIPAGIYTSITVSNSAKLTLASNGIYIIEGGGLSVLNSSSISGTNVLIVNAGSKYPTLGGTQTYGAITLSDSGTISLSPYATSGTYAGLVIFQTTDNKQPITVSGTASGALSGTIYAPAAALSVSNGAVIKGGLIVDTLALSNMAVVQIATAGAGSGAGAAPSGVQGLSGMGALPAAGPPGPQGLPAAPALVSGAGSRSTATGRLGGVSSVSTAAPTTPAASSRPVAMGSAGGSEQPDSSFLEDAALLTDVAVSLIAGQRGASKDSAPRGSKVRA